MIILAAYHLMYRLFSPNLQYLTQAINLSPDATWLPQVNDELLVWLEICCSQVNIIKNMFYIIWVKYVVVLSPDGAYLGPTMI